LYHTYPFQNKNTAIQDLFSFYTWNGEETYSGGRIFNRCHRAVSAYLCSFSAPFKTKKNRAASGKKLDPDLVQDLTIFSVCLETYFYVLSYEKSEDNTTKYAGIILNSNVNKVMNFYKVNRHTDFSPRYFAEELTVTKPPLVPIAVIHFP
jgi:hypothetical protein